MFDLFALPVRLMTTQGDFKTKRERKVSRYKYGTMCGSFLSFIMIGLAIFYLVVSISKMHNMKDDIYNSSFLLNHFDHGENEFHMYRESNFTPSI